jgi:hypothetical protein
VIVAALVLALALPSGDGSASAYPLHTHVTATVFWVGEPVGNGSTENNAVSAWDDDWLAHYGGVDDPGRRRAADGWFPRGFAPGENPFYVDLPYDDFTDAGTPRRDRMRVVPWARAAAPVRHLGRFSLLKNRWLKLTRDGRTCYAQWEDSGPYVYDDARYVFGADDRRPRNRLAHRAGIDVSPAVRDCLGFRGLNNDENTLDWQFVDAASVPSGPWTRVVTSRQIFWR